MRKQQQTIRLAALIYLGEFDVVYRFGNRAFGLGSGVGSVADPYAWPTPFLQNMGIYKATSQPATFAQPRKVIPLPTGCFDSISRATVTC